LVGNVALHNRLGMQDSDRDIFRNIRLQRVHGLALVQGGPEPEMSPRQPVTGPQHHQPLPKASLRLIRTLNGSVFHLNRDAGR